MAVINIAAAGDTTAGIAVRLRSSATLLAVAGNMTAAMDVVLKHPSAALFLAGAGESTAEMDVALGTVFTGNVPKRIIVHSPQRRCIVR